MNFKQIGLSVAAALFLSSHAVVADDNDPRDAILEALESHLPNLSIEAEQLSRSPIDGIWVLKIGPEVVYVDEQGEHLFQGDLIHLASRENLTENERASARSQTLDQVNPATRISYPAAEERYSVTVFTDIDCGYCRQLHRDMDEINEAGVTVHYLFYPRGGPGSAAWEKSDQVWCADDQHAAMDEAKSGASLDMDICDDTPTESHFEMGRQMQVTGTPAIVTQSGHVIRGYLPVDNLVSQIESLEGGE